MNGFRRMQRLVNIKMILTAFVALGALYSLATPIFEKPDEPQHFAYVKMLVDGRGLPSDLTNTAIDAPHQESSQPPLYYMTAALALRVFASDTHDFATFLQRGNPAVTGSLVDNDNKNLFLHLDGEATTWQATVLAVRFARWIALIFGMITVWATYRLGREMFSDRASIGLIAAGIVAFLPQFIFISSSASNDSAVAATCALALWCVARIVQRGWSPRRAIGLGTALGLAALSKVSAVALIPLSLLVVVGGTYPTPWRTAAKWLALTTSIIVLIAGSWYLRSLAVFGDALGLTTHLAAARPEPLSFLAAVHKLSPSIKSFWLAYGWSTVLAPAWVYVGLNALGGVGLLAALYALVIARERRTKWLLFMFFAWAVFVAILLVRWNQLISAPLGRLLFPAIAAFAVLVALGWTMIAAWLQRRLSVLRYLPALLPAGLFCLSILAVPSVLLPAYARPSRLTPDQIAQQPGEAAEIRYGDVARLIKLNLPHDHWPRPNEIAFIQLCWETLSPDPRELLVSVQIVGAGDRVVASRRTLPGLGSYPVSFWQRSIYFCDSVPVHIDAGTPTPAIDQVEVSVIDQATQERQPAFAPDGSPLDTDFVGQIKLAPEAYPVPTIEQPLAVRLGDQIDLIGYAAQPTTVRPGDSLRLRSYWRAARRPAANYTQFVHLRDTAGELIAQADGEPQSGTYPTSFWDPGEVVSDERTIAIPSGTAAGAYKIVMGLYHLTTGERLSVNGGPSTEITLPITVTVP